MAPISARRFASRHAHAELDQRAERKERRRLGRDRRRQSRGALLYALMDYDFVLIYPINPKSLSRYRGAFYPSGGKDACSGDYLLSISKPESGGARNAAGRSARGLDQSVDRSGPEGRPAQREDGL